MSERKILEELIQKGKDAEAKLAEVDKPKLRHGDYGYDSGGGMGEGEVFYVDTKSNPDFAYSQTENCCSCYVKNGWSRSFTKLGNIFDDLAAYGEDLEEFKMYWKDDSCIKETYGKIKGELCDGGIWLHIETNSAIYSPKKIREAAHKMLRMAATYERREGKKK